MGAQPDIGTAVNRVDGVVKVTGKAQYAAEYRVPDLLYGVVVSAAITRGRIQSIDTARARGVEGVVDVMTHENRPHVPWYDMDNGGEAANSKPPFRALRSDCIMFAGQPIALVLADTFEAARRGAMLISAQYEEEPPNTRLEEALPERYTPEKKKENNISKGDIAAACDAASAKVTQRYRLAMEHHNPMELHATTVAWQEDGTLTVYDKNQGSQNARAQLCQAFGFSPEALKVINPYVGGAFGSGLRPAYQAYLAMLAAIMLKRSVRVSLTRQQMFTHVHRPECIYDVILACDAQSKLTAIGQTATTSTSQFEAYTENIIGWAPSAYPSDVIHQDYAVAGIDTHTPGNMRAPGAATGVNLFEIAMDELAYAQNIDPLALRLANYSETNGLTGQPYSSKALLSAYQQAADRFGWHRRSPEPRSMREGKELVGWGMATGIWEAMMLKATARASFDRHGQLTIASAASDIGTGTYTIMAQIAAGALGLPLDRVKVRLGDSTLPTAGLEGGSSMATSVGTAVSRACVKMAHRLFQTAAQASNKPLGTARFEDVEFHDGYLRVASEPSRAVSIEDLVAMSGEDAIHTEGEVDPERDSTQAKAKNTHAAVFAEARVDEELGVVRVTRLVIAVAAGRIINPKTARSQILGGAVMGVGMALQEESMFDHRLGRIMNHNLAEYHVPTNADIHDIDIIFVEEADKEVSPLGLKGVGEIGIVGTAAAIANAIYHATGKRIRELPITPDKLL